MKNWFGARGSPETKPSTAVGLPDMLFFADQALPRREAERKFLFVGSTGTGKTLSIRLLMQSTFHGIRPGMSRRAMIYDPKGDMPGILEGMGLEIDVGLRSQTDRLRYRILNPFDRRAWAYDFARDFASCSSPVNAADNFAATLIPQAPGDTNHFFTSNAARVLSAIVQSLVRHTPGDSTWTLRDVVGIASDPRLVETVLGRDSLSQRITALFGVSAETYGNVLQTLGSYLWPLEAAATASTYHLSQGRGFTYSDWLAEGQRGTLILCGNYTFPHTVEPINGLFVEFLRQRLMVAPEVDWDDPDHAETWLFLDEFQDLHPVPDMVTFFTKSRSKGGIQVVGIQSVEQLFKRYSTEIGKTILGQFRNVLLLNLSCPSTAQYFTDRIGSFEELLQTTAVSQGYSGNQSTYTHTTNEQFVTRPGVLAQQLMILPEIGPELTITGYALYRGHFERVQFSAEREGLKPIRNEKPEDGYFYLDHLPSSAFEPKPFDATDFQRLKIRPPAGYEPAPKPPPPASLELSRTFTRWSSPTRRS